MGGLNASLSIAAGALSAQEAAIDVVNNNIANAATPGYDREVLNLSAASASDANGVSVGDGVVVNGVTSVSDQLLDLRLQQQTSEQAAASAQSGVLSTAELYFNTASSTASTVGTALSAFFTSLSALSSAPSNAADRQTVISNAQQLVDQFHTTSSGLTSIQTGLNTQIAGDVTQINSLSAQVASLNTEIADAGAAGQSSALVDQRSQLEQQLSGLTQISITSTPLGDTLTTGNGTALVAAGQSLPLTTSTGPNGLLQVVDSSGAAVTSSLTGGDLGGLITARDTNLPSYLQQLDTLASGFAKAVNNAQASGYDLSGNPGGALFTVPSSVTGSAAAIILRTTNGSAIAASSDGSSGSNGNVAALTAVQSSPLPQGASPTDSFAAIVNAVGNDTSQANTQSTAIQASLTQLTNQQNAVSGVSIDEESSNLIRYQQAYEAAAEVVTTIQSLFNTTIAMVGGTGGN